MNISKMNRDLLGMILFIASESVFFLLLVFAYVNFHTQYGNGASAAGMLDTAKTALFSIALFSSSLTLWLAEKAHAKHSSAAVMWMVVTMLLGAIFMVGQGTEYAELIRMSLSAETYSVRRFSL